jgi:hypothetical protein
MNKKDAVLGDTTHNPPRSPLGSLPAESSVREFEIRFRTRSDLYAHASFFRVIKTINLESSLQAIRDEFTARGDTAFDFHTQEVPLS